MLQLTRWLLVWGEGEVSLELGGVCLRVRLDGGDRWGLLGLLTSLVGSCSSELGSFRAEDLVLDEMKGLVGTGRELFLVFTMVFLRIYPY